MDNNSNGLELQRRVADWRREKGISKGWLGPTKVNISAKLGEEAGEFIRAVIGELEGRPDRGDVQQEAAQIIVALLAYFGTHHPEVDLFECVVEEVDRLLHKTNKDL